MDSAIAKKTQDSLGKVIKKPPLTDKLLSKPPFRFLHDIMTSVVKTTGFMQGLYAESEMNSENVKDKDAKIAFLQKTIDIVIAVTGKPLSVKPVKIVAGHEPEKTNELLQALASAINKNVDNDEYVRRVLKGEGGGKSSSKRDDKKEKDRERTKSADRRKSHDTGDKKDREKDSEKEKGDRERRSDRERDRDRDRHKDRDRESKTREKSRDGREDRHRDKSRKRDESGGKENESPARVNGEKEDKQDPPARLQRPSSAKGSRRRREAPHHADNVVEDDEGDMEEGENERMERDNSREEDEEFQKEIPASKEPMMGEGDLPPQITAARQLARPSSARPAPPRPKQEASESEPAMRLGTGQPTNLIVDNNDDDDDDDENFLVEESAPPPSEPEPVSMKPTEEEEGDHGALVKKMLESKKELEGGSQNQTSQPKKTEIERPTMSDAQRRKQREMVQKEVDKLRGSIQNLTRSANPLGKVLDYVQEDLDSMQQELDKWRADNTQHAMDLKREMNVTDRAVEPLRQQLTELDRAIGDQLDQIAATKSNIIKNDQKMEKMLRGIAKS